MNCQELRSGDPQELAWVHEKNYVIPWTGLSLEARSKDCAWALRRHTTMFHGFFRGNTQTIAE